MPGNTEYHAALNISKETSAGGQWRSVTVSTSDYAAGCLLNINFDVRDARFIHQTGICSCLLLQDSTLFRSIPLHLLKHTDIRAADRSLFFRKHCLGIHHTPCVLFTYPSSPTPETDHFHFSPNKQRSRAICRRKYLTPAGCALYRLSKHGVPRDVDLALAFLRRPGAVRPPRCRDRAPYPYARGWRKQYWHPRRWALPNVAANRSQRARGPCARYPCACAERYRAGRAYDGAEYASISDKGEL